MFSIQLQVSRSIIIDKPVKPIHSMLINLKTWQLWSPWLCLDKRAQLEFFGADGSVDSGYSWNGEWIGEGQVRYSEINADAMTLDLEFIKPWRSVAKAYFKLRPISSDSTEVTWLMKGSLPFFLFFMRDMMQAYIGMDYLRGLSMLKDYLETGVINSASEVLGITHVASTNYVGVRRTCAIDDIKNSFQGTCADLAAGFESNGFTRTGSPFTICHEWNPKSQLFDYTFAFPVTQLKDTEIPGLIQATRPEVKALHIQHVGEYKHLANAWATANSRIQTDKSLKQNKKQPSFEIYMNDPEQTPPNQLITEIYMPVY